jgi:hypothetical protein
MCNFMKLFRMSVVDCIQGIESSAPATTQVKISKEAKEDLRVWANFLMCPLKWLPISAGISEPPKWSREFVSDAAGLSDPLDFHKRPGCGNVAFDTDGTIIFAHQYLWPENFITNSRDEKGVRFGDKTTTLEAIGVIIPLLLVPELMSHRHVRVLVDCLGTMFGMQNKAARGDASATVFIRAAFLISGYLGCMLHVQHLPRISDWGALLTDRLSRSATTTTQDRKLLNSFNNRELPQCLVNWFHNPVSDNKLAYDLLNHVKQLC